MANEVPKRAAAQDLRVRMMRRYVHRDKDPSGSRPGTRARNDERPREGAGMMSAVNANVVVVDPPRVAEAVVSCWSTAVVRDRKGQAGRGFLNLKRLLGRPDQFRLVIEELARSVPTSVAVAAADKGAWPLVGALVLELGTPGVLVRPEPKVHLIDDVVYSGETLRSAAALLTSVGLVVDEASVIVGANTAEAVAAMVSSSVLERVTCLVLATDLNLGR